MLRGIFFALTFIVALIGCSVTAAADKRIALIVGNSAYRNIGELTNPRNDAKAIAKLFGDAKFDVVDVKIDVTGIQLRQALREFAIKSQHADFAVVFFAGHGIEVGGNNYLIPIDAKLAHELDVEDEAVSLERVLRTVEPAKRLRLVLLDACRDNPFVAKMRRISATRSASRGLARIEIETSDTYVAFAAKAGSTAMDGDSLNSPFTKALLAHLMTPDLDIRMALGKVRDAVLRETKRQQEPYVYGSLGGDVIALVSSPNHESQPKSPGTSSRVTPKSQSLDVGTVRSFHDAWQVRCQLSGTPPQDQCAVIQSVTAEDRPNIGLSVIMLKTDDKKLLMRVLAPLGILMPSGLGLKIDETDIGRAGFVRCMPNGCVAEVVVDDNLKRQLRTGKNATFIIFQTPDEGIGIPIALSGLDASLNALP